ncbi:hypothetical protein MHU86_17251 [Fragilaria crotonensis]|nr:hypothetical protein MHU86_17251 [Fragilaria crotonensis]
MLMPNRITKDPTDQEVLHAPCQVSCCCRSDFIINLFVFGFSRNHAIMNATSIIHLMEVPSSGDYEDFWVAIQLPWTTGTLNSSSLVAWQFEDRSRGTVFTLISSMAAFKVL